MSAISAHVDRLRTLRSDAPKVPTLEQLRLVTHDVYNVVPLAETLGRPEFTEFTARDLCAIVEDFGKFRARSAKGEAKAATMLVDEFIAEAGMLFCPSRQDLLAWNRNLARARNTGANPTRWNGQELPESLRTDPPPVIVPNGYEPTLIGRNIKASLAAMVKTLPTDAALERYFNRRYAESEDELTAEHLHLVWWLATMRLEDKLAELTGETETLNRLLIAAHDLLEAAIGDARDALAALAAPDAYTLPAGALTGLAAQCSWTNPGMFSRIVPVVDTLTGADSPRARNLLRTRLGAVRSWFAGEAGALVDIAQLNEAHIRALVERSGLAYDAAAEKEVRAEVRTRLVELGFAADLDQEVPAGVSAWRQGRLAEFYSSREARAAGDPDWALLYSPTVAESDAAPVDPAAVPVAAPDVALAVS